MERGIRGNRLNGSVAAPRRDAPGTTPSPIAPDLAIRIAYAFGYNLRSKGCDDADFDRLTLAWVERRFADTTLLPHIRAGFAAGFHGRALPTAWVPPSAGR